MSQEKLENNETIKSYFLSSEDFKKKPINLVKYNVGDKVKRDNFSSYITHSFAFSRGVPDKQRAFFGWIKSRYGFDSEVSISELIKAGGWKALGDNEKENFLLAFNRVKEHIDRYGEESKEELERTISNEFIRISDEQNDRRIDTLVESLSRKQTFSEFNLALEEEYPRWKKQG